MVELPARVGIRLVDLNGDFKLVEAIFAMQLGVHARSLRRRAVPPSLATIGEGASETPLGLSSCTVEYESIDPRY
jgi:hypothetical protein